MKYYKVVCERAHVGKGRTAYIVFYFKAENALHAMNCAKLQRGTKRSKMPIACYEVSEPEYLDNISTSAYVRCGART